MKHVFNVTPPKTTNYGALLKKLKKELVESTRHQLTRNQKKINKCMIQLIASCASWMFVATMDIICPLHSHYLTSQFVDIYVIKKTKFLKQHNKSMLTFGIDLSHFSQFILKLCFHIEIHFCLIFI